MFRRVGTQDSRMSHVPMLQYVAAAVLFIVTVSALQSSQHVISTQPRDDLDARMWPVVEPNINDDVYVRLWNGADLTEEEVGKLSHNPPRLFLENRLFDPGNRSVKVLGLFSGGTNLLHEFLQQNGFSGESTDLLDAQCEDAIQARQLVPCDTFWKHTNPLRIQDFRGNESSLLVAMVRNPFAQIASWMRSSFNLRPCIVNLLRGDVDGACPCDEFQTEHPDLHCPCGKVNVSLEDEPPELRYNFVSTLPDGVQRLANAPKQTYEGVADVWNTYVAAYKLLEQSSFANVLVVRYEDLVLNPKKVLRQIADAIGEDTLTEVSIVDDNARTFDSNSVGRDQAIQNINEKSYMKDLLSHDISTICKALKKNLLEQFDYECE